MTDDDEGWDAMTLLERERERAAALLRITESDPVQTTTGWVDPAEVGALDAYGYAWPDSAARLTVLIFPSYEAAVDAAAGLPAGVPGEWETRVTMNGALLLWATAPADDTAAVEQIVQLSSWFAGEE